MPSIMAYLWRARGRRRNFEGRRLPSGRMSAADEKNGGTKGARFPCGNGAERQRRDTPAGEGARGSGWRAVPASGVATPRYECKSREVFERVENKQRTIQNTVSICLIKARHAPIRQPTETKHKKKNAQ